MTNLFLNYRFIFLVSLLVAILPYEYSWSQDINVVASVNKNPAILEDIVTLSVAIHGTRQPATLTLPDLSDFQVQSQGTSSSIRIINGSMKTSVTHNYQLIPKREGKFQLKPIKVDVENRTYQSNPLTLTIMGNSTPNNESESLAFAKLSVSNSKPFINEQVALKFKLYRRVDAKNINLNWSFDPFHKEDLGKGREFPELVNGIKYLVHELEVALFGPRVGSFQVGPATVELDLVFQDRQRRMPQPFENFFNDPFFNRGQRLEHKIIRSKPLNIQVKPLPEKDTPTLKGFTPVSSQLTLINPTSLPLSRALSRIDS